MSLSLIGTATYSGLDWKTREHRASQTEKIDYGCNFANGECRVKRELNRPDDWRVNTPMCCCKGCQQAQGYLYELPEDHVEEINALFSDETGFWRKEVGCTLPRKWRSDVCLSYNCLPNAGLREAIEKYLRTGKGIRSLTK